MHVEPNYKGFRLEVAAQHVNGALDAEVRIRRSLSEEKPHVETITCRKPTASIAEERAAIYARRWVDRAAAGHGRGRLEPFSRRA